MRNCDIFRCDVEGASQLMAPRSTKFGHTFFCLFCFRFVWSVHFAIKNNCVRERSALTLHHGINHSHNSYDFCLILHLVAKDCFLTYWYWK